MTTVQAMSLSENDLITSIINSFYFVDYGYINQVNSDKTVNVTHANKTVMIDGTELNETITNNVEVLTVCGAGFAVSFDYKANDKVLLLGLKDYIPNVANVKKAEVPSSFVHYDRATLKALPLCVFSDEAKVKMMIEEGKLTIESENETIINAKEIQTQSDSVKINVDSEFGIEGGKVLINGDKIELNGNSKQFVTWSELNTALSTFVQNLNISLQTGATPSGGGKVTFATPPPSSIDISSAKSQKVVLGG